MRARPITTAILTLAFLTLAGAGTVTVQAQPVCASGTYTYTFTSFCPFPIWIGQSAAVSNGRSYPPQGGNWALAGQCKANTDCASGICDLSSGQCSCKSSGDCSGGAACAAGQCSSSATFCMPKAWDSGTFWPRTGCTSDGNGHLDCATGQCTPAGAMSGLLDCGVGITSPTNPVTQFEVTSTAGNTNYDVSAVAGFNVETRVTPSGGSYLVPGVPAGQNAVACYPAGCIADLNRTCPENLKVKSGNAIVGCLDTCTQCQRTGPSGSTPNPQVHGALMCDSAITRDFSGNTPVTTLNCSAASDGLPTYQDMYCVQHFGETPANAQASSNQGTPTAFSQSDCFPGTTFILPTYPGAYHPPAGHGVCLYANPPQSTIPHFNDYGWFDWVRQKTLNCGGTPPSYADALPDGTPCGGYLTKQGKKGATYAGALGYTCQTVTFSDSQHVSQTAHLCLPPTTSGLGVCTFDTFGDNPLYTGVGGIFNATWLTAGLQAGGGTTPYYQTFKAACPSAYTWQYDDDASGFGCNAAAVPNGGKAFSGFDVTFCASLSQPTAPGGPNGLVVGFQGSGKAQNVGAGKDSGNIRISGRFTLPGTLPLDRATLKLVDLLDEAQGAGELARAAGGTSLLPITLTARPGSKPSSAIFQTASGIRPSVMVEIKSRDPRTGVMEFSITADRSTIAGPTRCAGSSVPTTLIETGFELQVGASQVRVGDRLSWQCRGKELRTP